MDKKIFISSVNPVTVNATKVAFNKFFSNVVVNAQEVSSGVSEQPINEELSVGARNRVQAIKSSHENKQQIDYYVGIESGRVELFSSCDNFGR